MKKILSIASMLALGVMLQANAVSAHVDIVGIESGTLFQFPTGMEPTLDGDLSEWDIVPEDYYVPFESHFEYYLGLGHENDESNLSFRVVAGWSQGTNRLYFMMERFDNYWDRNGVGAVAGGDDSWEIMIDSDHGGDQHWYAASDFESEEEHQRNQGRYAQNAHCRFPPLEPFGWKWWFQSKSTWHDVPPWGDYGFQLDGESNAGEVTARIEIMSAAWDDFHWMSPEESEPEHTFVEGNTIGLGWVVHDMDNDAEDNSGSTGGWGINPNIQMWFDCGNCSDFLLAPIDPRVDFSQMVTGTAVEEESWGRIKAAYIQQ